MDSIQSYHEEVESGESLVRSTVWWYEEPERLGKWGGVLEGSANEKVEAADCSTLQR